MIDIQDITIRISGKVLLDKASAHISDNQKVGLVGTNGCGKSTLFRALLGGLETETGSISLPERAKVASVAQEITDTTVPVLDYVLSQDKERASLLSRLDNASVAEQAEIHERLMAIGSASAPARASAILYGLGFSNADLSRPISEFSGGWRMRLSLAAALFQPSDILLLDEPTNHLDLETSIWLENHLRRYPKTLLLISHDRSILNSVCDHIILFDHQKLVTYSGNYDTFSRTRAAQKELLEKQYKKQEQKRRHMEAFVERFRYKATKAKQAQSRLKLLAKLPNITLIEDNTSTRFNFPEPQELPPPLLTVEDVSVGYGDNIVFKKLNFSIVNNDRIALLGANGNGKSTLAKLLSGRLLPLSGSLRASSKLNIGYFAQHQAEELPMEQTPLEYMSSLMPTASETAVRSHLAGFGLEQEKALTPIANLSGGEKARLLFAAMSRTSPQLLILDEPTNHLDMDARDALVEALNTYQGSVILITHDFNLIELVADDLWLVAKGRCLPFAGDLSDYKAYLLSSSDTQTAKAEKQEAERRQKLKDEKKQRQTLDKERQAKLRQVEKSLAAAQSRQAELTALFAGELTVEAGISAQKELKALETTIDELENQWLELSVADN